MAGITVLETLEADVPTPATLKDTIFVDPTNGLGYKDDAGAVTYVATGGTVTNTGTLTDHALIVGNGGVDVSALASLGTTTTVLHGNAAGDPTFGAVSLTADVSGDLPFANLVQATGASKIVGRGSASGAGDFEELTISTGLTLTGTVLTATGAGGTVTTTGSPASGNLTKFTGASSISNADLTGDVTTSGTVATTIANSAVTLAKIANAAANSKLVGSGSAGSGAAYSELTLGSNLAMSGTTLNASVPSALGITIDGGGVAITTGVKGFLSVPFACTITANTLLSTDASATSGSIVIDIWKDTYANYPPTNADTITASAKPTLTAANKSTDSTLTGWTTAVSAGDVLGFNVDSAATVTRVTLVLKITVP